MALLLLFFSPPFFFFLLLLLLATVCFINFFRVCVLTEFCDVHYALCSLGEEERKKERKKIQFQHLWITSLNVLMKLGSVLHCIYICTHYFQLTIPKLNNFFFFSSQLLILLFARWYFFYLHLCNNLFPSPIQLTSEIMKKNKKRKD